MDTKAELLQAMQAMIEAQNWQGYLYFRRDYVVKGGNQSAIGKMIRSLPSDIQLTYARYFNTCREVSNPVKNSFSKEAALKVAAKQAERQAAYQQPRTERTLVNGKKFINSLDKKPLTCKECYIVQTNYKLPQQG